MKRTVDLVWDLTREPLTVGGALVLRQEGEILSRLNNKEGIKLHVICRDSEQVAIEELAAKVFGSSILPFELVYSSTDVKGWPKLSVRSDPGFSYFSFARLIALHQKSGIEPKLAWSPHHEALAKRARERFLGRLICVHLRFVTPFTLEESNADGPTWQVFFDKHAEAGVCDFLLIGDDELPSGLTLGPGVNRAVDLKIELVTQLALTSIADGFMGMASGLCTAANLSEVPHVIFKHPAHHSVEMSIEMGSSVSFPFAKQRQQLWRREVDPVSLDAALDLISL